MCVFTGRVCVGVCLEVSECEYCGSAVARKCRVFFVNSFTSIAYYNTQLKIHSRETLKLSSPLSVCLTDTRSQTTLAYYIVHESYSVHGFI